MKVICLRTGVSAQQPRTRGQLAASQHDLDVKLLHYLDNLLRRCTVIDELRNYLGIVPRACTSLMFCKCPHAS